jgi:hypothetical protein
MAFNAIYGGEPDRRERPRVMASIRNNFSEEAAMRVLDAAAHAADSILETPPGNTRLPHTHPKFRTETIELAAQYRQADSSARDRLAALGGIIYQVRCSLIHGSKDPTSARDRMLIGESQSILRLLLPELENQLL